MPALPPAPEAEQPTYTVQRGTVTRSLEFTARVAPVQQAKVLHDTSLTKKSRKFVWTITEGLKRSLQVLEIRLAEKLHHECP